MCAQINNSTNVTFIGWRQGLLFEDFRTSSASLVAQLVKSPPANAEDARHTGLILGLAKSPGEGYGNPLQYSCLENSWTEEHGGLLSMGSQRVGHD